ncbi:MAG: isocitrate lyase/phosphoenolpyruvate mutase family protein [Pseudomonadota bacterium]
MSTSLLDKAKLFADLHTREGIFVMPNAWDEGSAKFLAAQGFPALATTSGGVNWARGREDYVYAVPADEMLEAYGRVADCVDLPVSGDLEDGYATEPEKVAETIRRAASLGMVGGGIEDFTGDDKKPLYDMQLAVERIRAARSAADEAGFPFTLTARCEIFYFDVENKYAEAVKRANLYREAGADCLFLPGGNTPEIIEGLVKEIDAPLNVVAEWEGPQYTVTQLEDLGVKRISTGGSMARACYATLHQAAEKLAAKGTFDYLGNAISDPAMSAFFKQPDKANLAK